MRGSAAPPAAAPAFSKSRSPAIQGATGRDPRARPAAQSPLPSDDDLAPLRRTFLDNRRRDIAALTQSLAEGDFAGIAATGHRIKGLAGSYGFHEIGEAAIALEQAARNGAAGAVEEAIRDLSRLVSRPGSDRGQAA